MSVLAVGSLWAKACQVERTHDAANVAHRALGTIRTEPALIIDAFWDFQRRINVQVQAFWRLSAIAIFCEKHALRHLAQVILMEKLAVSILLTQATEPMLAYDFIMEQQGHMLIRAGIAIRT